MKPVLLCICDGIGIRNEQHGNAFLQANKPNFNFLFAKYPHCLLEASGTEVGLPDGQMGNSEVGHMNIGAGRVVYQPLELINEAIRTKAFFQNEEIQKVIRHTKKEQSKLHLIGLLSDGGVHSHIDHLLALLELCKQENVFPYLHLFTDGRDVSPKSALTYLQKVQDKLEEIGLGTIATIGGRYYGMDRDNNYDRLEKAYQAMVNHVGHYADSMESYIQDRYEKGITDEFLEPVILDESGNIEENDGIIAFNFRKDRLREILTALTNPDFKEMKVARFHNLKVVTMLPVVESVIAPHAFNDPTLTNILGEYVAKQGKKQLRIAETEKYAHVTFFFDGGKEIDYKGEKKILIPSPKVATYDLLPEMSAKEITDTLLEELNYDYDLIILNFANGDMVGHTGNLEAAIKAVETVDTCLGKLYQKIRESNGVMIVTADHGNCEWMLDEENHIITSHSTNKVPFLITKEGLNLQNGKLADIAPTVLSLMELEVPKEMTGTNLIKEDK